MAKKSRELPEINAGSMADIAFLLLIFFLVTTTMNTDKGLPVLLPPPVKEKVTTVQLERNVLKILINQQDKLLVEGEWAEIEDLTQITKDFILNNGKDANSSESPQKAIVSLKNDRRTSYDIYVKVQNEVKRAYNEIYDNYCMEQYGKKFEDCSNSVQKKIRLEIFPQRISEAEPEDVGGN